VWRFFTQPEARARHDPETGAAFARESVADLRAATARYPGDARLTSLIDRLLDASEEFRELWQRREVAVRRSASKRLRHPRLGWLDLECQAMHLPDADQWVVFYTAAPGTPSHDALRLLRVIGTQEIEGDLVE
jgi:hypothetical protein